MITKGFERACLWKCLYSTPAMKPGRYPTITSQGALNARGLSNKENDKLRIHNVLYLMSVYLEIPK